MAEKLYDLWAKRTPNWEKRFEDSIIKNFSDYGKGVTTLGQGKTVWCWLRSFHHSIFYWSVLQPKTETHR